MCKAVWKQGMDLPQWISDFRMHSVKFDYQPEHIEMGVGTIDSWKCASTPPSKFLHDCSKPMPIYMLDVNSCTRYPERSQDKIFVSICNVLIARTRLYRSLSSHRLRYMRKSDGMWLQMSLRHLSRLVNKSRRRNLWFGHTHSELIVDFIFLWLLLNLYCVTWIDMQWSTIGGSATTVRSEHNQSACTALRRNAAHLKSVTEVPECQVVALLSFTGIQWIYLEACVCFKHSCQSAGSNSQQVVDAPQFPWSQRQFVGSSTWNGG